MTRRTKIVATLGPATDPPDVLKAVLRDLKGLSNLVNDVLMPHQSVAHVRSSIVLDRLKESSKLPLKEIKPG